MSTLSKKIFLDISFFCEQKTASESTCTHRLGTQFYFYFLAMVSDRCQKYISITLTYSNVRFHIHETVKLCVFCVIMNLKSATFLNTTVIFLLL